MRKKIGRKVRLEGKHALAQYRGEVGTLIQIEHHLQCSYFVRLDREVDPPTHPSHNRIISVKEDALVYANKEGEFEEDS